MIVTSYKEFHLETSSMCSSDENSKQDGFLYKSTVRNEIPHIFTA